MGLFPKDEPGQAMFFSPAKITAIRAYQAEAQAQKDQETLNKERQRQDKAADKERKAQEAQQRRETRQRETAEKRALQEQAKEDRRRQKEADLQLRHELQASQYTSIASLSAPKRKFTTICDIEAPQVKAGMSRSRGSIALPKRFRDKKFSSS